ncbi:MAG: NADPH-dependent glutamate synthase [Candidatus Heimdallarchaeota archaeon]|nr:NADPH-dependent glutamate synthase [Candidatus Heimdallarchaeota archaeon]
MKEQLPEERIKNFDEVPFGYTEEEAIKEAERCLDCRRPHCVKGCPVDINIPGFIEAIVNHDFEEGIRIIKETNVLPSICGRVCPQEVQCEQKCILGRRKEFEPVAIGRLERFLADWEREHGRTTPEIASPTGKKVAVVGSGPAGIVAASELARFGHEVTLFESLHKTGGVLIYGIPEFRLPKAILAEELQTLEDMGVEIITNTVIGLTYTLDDLWEMGYESIFLGTGAGLPRYLGIPGENLDGVYFANEFLTRVNLMEAYKFPHGSDTPVKIGKKVATIGAGNVAMDCARTALRLGADESYIIYRRTINEAPARQEEIHHAEEEGVIFKCLSSPLGIIGDENGKVVGIECQECELGEPDESGRCRPLPIEGACFDIEIDTLIIAIGQRPNPLVPNFTADLETESWGGVIVDPETQETSIPGVFAGGDLVTGAATVILAMGAGRDAAKSMHKYLMGESEEAEEDQE